MALPLTLVFLTARFTSFLRWALCFRLSPVPLLSPASPLGPLCFSVTNSPVLPETPVEKTSSSGGVSPRGGTGGPTPPPLPPPPPPAPPPPPVPPEPPPFPPFLPPFLPPRLPRESNFTLPSAPRVKVPMKAPLASWGWYIPPGLPLRTSAAMSL